MNPGELPRGPAVCRISQVCLAFFGMLVIAPSDKSMQRITKGNRKNSRGFRPMNNRCLGDRPHLAAVLRAENPGRLASGSEPDVGISLCRDAAAAGGERAFALDSRRKSRRFPRTPVHTILGREQ